jgi:mercuric ion binding protein
MNQSLALLLAAVASASAAWAAGPRTATLAVTDTDCAVRPITVRKAFEKAPGVASAKVQATADAGFPSSVEAVQ